MKLKGFNLYITCPIQSTNRKLHCSFGRSRSYGTSPTLTNRKLEAQQKDAFSSRRFLYGRRCDVYSQLSLQRDSAPCVWSRSLRGEANSRSSALRMRTHVAGTTFDPNTRKRLQNCLPVGSYTESSVNRATSPRSGLHGVKFPLLPTASTGSSIRTLTCSAELLISR